MQIIGLSSRILLIVVISMSVGTVGAHRRSVWTKDSENKNAIQTRISDLGEKETRITVNGIRAMETTVPSQGENFLFVKEAVKNNRLVWLVYKDKYHIIDCNISRSAQDVEKFVQKFTGHKSDNSENEIHAHDKSKSGKAAKHNDLLNFRGLLRECRSFKKQIRAMRIQHHHAEHQHKNQKHGKLNHEGHKDQDVIKSRSKRGVFSMIYPGTKWCGAGDKASGGYDDLGENVATDRCCREHDHCPYTISGFSKDYNYWNYRFHTLLHCTCEERFKSCLKSAGNSIANMVGYIYFNYVGTKCFNLKPVKACKKRSWWGKCKKYDTQYTAQLLESDLKY